ncbi:hypothetical protein ASG25_01890 [Rhizobium sp. Leaf384]|uniref:hypothetical protein n=1 Tax=unclassified Rhizobium TaxID=2613769 RepID=UPI0007131E73|nr:MULTISPECIES: hypothetical protein [unclassified Rhizobium]KQS74190.1 hypothetical protein ASG58_16955 [Rhizobium sp. Leaf383]KQS80385.1 hypothetical protein ASG25_01890 [Rhizobium sp. Leaf384]
MTDPLASLPMFATDKQIAVAIIGKERADLYVKTVIPQLMRKGFPQIDPLHGGRPVPLVRKFYDGYFGITVGFAATAPDGEERLGESLRRRKQKELKA